MADPPARAEHVVVVFWTACADSVNEKDTPTLFKLAKEGTTFANNHCVFVSSTEVNGTALAQAATHAQPASWQLRISPRNRSAQAFSTESEEASRKRTSCRTALHRLATVAEIVRRGGGGPHCRSKPVRDWRTEARGAGATMAGVLYQASAAASLKTQLVNARGEFPKTPTPRPRPIARRCLDHKALVENMWPTACRGFRCFG